MSRGFVIADYQQIKNCVSMVMVLDHYRLLNEIKGKGTHLRGCCPIHRGSNDKQFVVNTRTQTWFCFGDCRKGGSVLEFVSLMENIDIQAAALRIAAWFYPLFPHAQLQRSTSMSEHQKPTHKAFVVEDREDGADAFWTRIGSAWPHKDGKGFNITLSALPTNGRIVLREFSEEEEEEKPAKRPNVNARR